MIYDFTISVKIEADTENDAEIDLNNRIDADYEICDVKETPAS